MDEYLTANIVTFGLILSRMVGYFIMVPFFSSMQLPAVIKSGLAFFLTLVLFPVLTAEGLVAGFEPLQLFLWVIIEILTGLVMGFTLQITFITIQLAGEFIDLRMGFALANVIDPQTGEQMPLAGQLKTIFATLVFITVRGHHLLIQGLYRSYEVLPLGDPFPAQASGALILRICGDLFIIGFSMALPVIACLFVADVIFGFLARTIPQINIFVVGLPTKILLGIFMLFLAVPVFVNYAGQIFEDMFNKFHQLLRVWGG